MSIHSIYTESVTIPKDSEFQLSSDEALQNESLEFKKQRYAEWHKIQETKEILSLIQKEIDDKSKEAIQLAASYPSHKNHDKVIHTLIVVNTLKEILNKMTYVS